MRYMVEANMGKMSQVMVLAGALAAACGPAAANGRVHFTVTFGAPVYVAPPPVYYYYVPPPPPRVVYYPAAVPAYPVYYAPAVRVVRPHGWRPHPQRRWR
jgi:hypothetical protein